MKRILILMSTFIVVALALLGFLGYKLSNQEEPEENKPEIKNPISFVTININPEVELVLDEDDNVLEVVPINADADVLLSDLNLIGLDVEEATEKIIDSAMEAGYLDEYSDENAIVVTTVNNDEDDRDELEEKVMTKMNSHLEAKKVYPVLVAKGLSDELKAEALTYNISNGKMLLIERAISLDATLIKENLVNNSVQDIQKMIQSYVNARHNALKQTIQNLKEEWKSQKTTLRQAYLTKVEELKSTIIAEHSEEFKNMTTEQRDAAIQNYLSAEKETIKNNINAVKEDIKAEIKDSKESYPVLKNSADTIKENVKKRIQEKRNKIRG